MLGLHEVGHIRNTVVLHFTYSDVAWVLVFSETQVQPQVILNPDHLPDYISLLL